MLASTVNRPVHSMYIAAIDYGGLAGRPRYDIPQDQLEYLLQSRFSVPQIALLLNVLFGEGLNTMIFLLEVYMQVYRTMNLMS